MKKVITDFVFEGKNYLLEITYKKRKKNITFRYRNNSFFVSTPLFVSKKRIFECLNKYASKLIKSYREVIPYNDSYIYVLGKKMSLLSKVINFNDGTSILFTDVDDLLKSLKKLALKLFTNYTRYFEKVMGINFENKVKVRDMKTRYGTNHTSKKIITFNTVLIHYDIEIIKSVIIHELAHCFVFNHGKDFYDVVLKYCPDYYELDYKLKKESLK